MDIVRKYYPGKPPIKKKFSVEEHRIKAKEHLDNLKQLDDGTVVEGAKNAIRDIENVIRKGK